MLNKLLCVLLLLLASGSRGADDYQFGPDSMPNEGVPKGRVEKFTFGGSEIFKGTERDCWIYIPAQYDGSEAAALMVFQDGHAYVNANGQMRVPVVFDNLIHAKEMPVTIALFLNPGHRGENAPDGNNWGPRNNRSFEYDTLSDDYARFLIEEFIPFATKKFELELTDDPNLRAICGMSSGGICAFTAAWERPEYFGKVLSHIGSFTNIRGGHNYPALIRKTERKPLRVFLQDGANDLNNAHGSWPLANQQMALALQFAGYDMQFVFGDGAHNGKHGGAILPDSLRWLWKHEAPIATQSGAKEVSLTKIVPESNEWELVGEGYGFTDAACSDAEGNFYFSDLPRGTLYKVGASGKPEVWLENGPKISGMKFGADGQLYAATQGMADSSKDQKKKIIAIDPQTKKITEIGTDVDPNDLVVSKAGWIYFTDTGKGQVVRAPVSARGMSRPPTAAGGINRPNGIALSADHQFLIVSEYGGTNGWRFGIAEDGSLSSGERYMNLRVPEGRMDSGGDGMITDRESRSYITSHSGVQVFDSAGSLNGVIGKPTKKGMVSAAFAGPKHEWLYVCASDQVFRRKMLVQGATRR